MALEGLHHITAITADAPANVDFYARVLGLRLVKKTVNFDAPDVYHLYYGDQSGTPGSIMTFFEFPGTRLGRAGAGMVHRIVWRVADTSALDFWSNRLEAEGIATHREDGALRFADPEGLDIELLVPAVPDQPLAADSPGIPGAYALQGFDGVRAYTTEPEASAPLLDALGFTAPEENVRTLGDRRHAFYAYDEPPDDAGFQGAGTVHHVAWSAADDDELRSVRADAVEAGAQATNIIDRQYFHSVYFREPSGVLFELATRDIGFAVDEPPEHLGEALRLPPQYEAMREQLERTLTPLPGPRSS